MTLNETDFAWTCSLMYPILAVSRYDMETDEKRDKYYVQR